MISTYSINLDLFKSLAGIVTFIKNNEKNTISVVIPVSMSKNYIEKTINDVLNKTDVDEIIFVDDASTDRSVEIVKNIK